MHPAASAQANTSTNLSDLARCSCAPHWVTLSSVLTWRCRGNRLPVDRFLRNRWEDDACIQAVAKSDMPLAARPKTAAQRCTYWRPVIVAKVAIMRDSLPCHSSAFAGFRSSALHVQIARLKSTTYGCRTRASDQWALGLATFSNPKHPATWFRLVACDTRRASVDACPPSARHHRRCRSFFCLL